jgi:hypothetical protein
MVVLIDPIIRLDSGDHLAAYRMSGCNITHARGHVKVSCAPGERPGLLQKPDIIAG